jgi:preprotein translocase subunit SecG
MNASWTDILIDILLVIYVIDCAFMGLVIMMQRSKQEGLGAAFGGGFTESVWGAQTSQVLVKATVYAAILFFILSIVLARLYSHRNSLLEKGSTLQQELLKPVAPATTPAALPNATTNAPGQPVTPAAASPSAAPMNSTTVTPSPAKPGNK